LSKVRVYCAVSLDGFIAGSNDDLAWLGEPDPEQACDPDTIGVAAFMEGTGAMLMGRRTYDQVMSFDCDWPYGSTPVLVATSRPFTDAPTTVSACRGDIAQMCEQAREVADEKDVYLDGGNVISQALEADIVDDLLLTVVPVLLGHGVPLYQGARLQRFDVENLGRLGEMHQLRLRITP